MKFYHDYHAQSKENMRKLRRRRKAPAAVNQKIRNEQEYQLWRWLWRYMGLP